LKKLFLLLAILTYGLICRADEAKTTHLVSITKDPMPGSEKVTSVPSGQKVSVLEKKGFWVKIALNGQSGWLKLNDIELTNATTNIDALATGRTSSGNVVNTAGVRGLSPEDLKNSKSDTNAVEISIKNNNLIKDADLASFMSSSGLTPGSRTPQLRNVKTTMTGNIESPETTTTTNKPKQKNNLIQKTKDDENW